MQPPCPRARPLLCLRGSLRSMWMETFFHQGLNDREESGCKMCATAKLKEPKENPISLIPVSLLYLCMCSDLRCFEEDDFNIFQCFLKLEI